MFQYIITDYVAITCLNTIGVLRSREYAYCGKKICTDRWCRFLTTYAYTCMMKTPQSVPLNCSGMSYKVVYRVRETVIYNGEQLTSLTLWIWNVHSFQLKGSAPSISASASQKFLCKISNLFNLQQRTNMLSSILVLLIGWISEELRGSKPNSAWLLYLHVEWFSNPYIYIAIYWVAARCETEATCAMFSTPYSQKYWRSLNLAVWPKTYRGGPGIPPRNLIVVPSIVNFTCY